MRRFGAISLCRSWLYGSRWRSAVESIIIHRAALHPMAKKKPRLTGLISWNLFDFGPRPEMKRSGRDRRRGLEAGISAPGAGYALRPLDLMRKGRHRHHPPHQFHSLILIRNSGKINPAPLRGSLLLLSNRPIARTAPSTSARKYGPHARRHTFSAGSSPIAALLGDFLKVFEFSHGLNPLDLMR